MKSRDRVSNEEADGGQKYAAAWRGHPYPWVTETVRKR
jgi:hypothetical protein